jgi:hypothetical protein
MTAAMTDPRTHRESTAAPVRPSGGIDVPRISTRFGLAFSVCQISVMIVMATLVLPHGGSPDDPALERGQNVLDAIDLYRAGNYAFLLAGILLLGFLGVVQARLRRIDTSGALATIAVGAGTLLAFVWPFAAVLHDVALDAGKDGADLRLLGAWDAVAPYSLAFSALPRVFLVGALVLGLRAAGTNPWLRRTGLVIVVLSVVGSATLVAGAVFPVLALSTLMYEVWIGALAWQWLREGRTTA